jgi:hypothetical protein
MLFLPVSGFFLFIGGNRNAFLCSSSPCKARTITLLPTDAKATVRQANCHEHALLIIEEGYQDFFDAELETVDAVKKEADPATARKTRVCKSSHEEALLPGP